MGTFQTDQTEEEMVKTLFILVICVDVIKLFTARMSKNFRWPSLMPEYLRRSTFDNITVVGSKSDGVWDEFARHENEWVTVHNQKVIECGQMYDDDKLVHILELMPGIVQIPVDQTKLPCSPSAKMENYYFVMKFNNLKGISYIFSRKYLGERAGAQLKEQLY
ncbi:hypothetical protein GLOIN_2v1598270 [Rhizophagus clarus]|uniref:Uncharacterized protein n=1 Tax=Rhizophagus clarus TaxID=94130 RepID=A0A8H3MBV6_9GLOM|nr:hypothetical protein GLOIN_2v1598270 [Rhizophagus clarus]